MKFVQLTLRSDSNPPAALESVAVNLNEIECVVGINNDRYCDIQLRGGMSIKVTDAFARVVMMANAIDK